MQYRSHSRLLTVFPLILIWLSSLAALPAAALHQDPYPPPEPMPEMPSVPAVSQPYPSRGGDIFSPPAATGGDAQVVDSQVSQEPGSGVYSRGLTYLWLGFLAALLIFVASVIGSILLFTRRGRP